MTHKVLDLFCGAGGLSLGFQKAGFEIVGGVDFDPQAMETHKANFKSRFEFCGDIKSISNETIIDKLSDVDVIIGGPPCQGFSIANRYEKEVDDPRNKLFFEFMRFVQIIKPKVFVIENVPGILTKDDGYAKDRILDITSNGQTKYKTNVNVLNANDYGVPQLRRRAFFVGIREDLNVIFDFKSLKKSSIETTVADAIGDLCDPKIDNKSALSRILRDSDIIQNHDITVHKPAVVQRISHVKPGENWSSVPSHLWDTNRNNRHSSAYRRLSLDKPSITIDTGHMNYFHPIENRVPTVRESARIQTFPDSFIFMGGKGAQYRQVGNAVPPLLSKVIAESILELINYAKNEND